MKHIAFASFALLTGVCAAPALAQDVPLTDDEFKTLIVGKTMESMANGKRYMVQLLEGGKAIISDSYNDVGRWRHTGGGSYCNAWNKQSPAENCVTMVRRDGKLAAIRPDGSVAGVIEAIR